MPTGVAQSEPIVDTSQVEVKHEVQEEFLPEDFQPGGRCWPPHPSFEEDALATIHVDPERMEDLPRMFAEFQEDLKWAMKMHRRRLMWRRVKALLSPLLWFSLGVSVRMWVARLLR